MIVQLDQCAEHLLAECRDAPAAGVGDLGQQAAEMQTLQQARHFARLPAKILGHLDALNVAYSQEQLDRALQQAE
jgi:hypothetical protein